MKNETRLVQIGSKTFEFDEKLASTYEEYTFSNFNSTTPLFLHPFFEEDDIEVILNTHSTEEIKSVIIEAAISEITMFGGTIE